MAAKSIGGNSSDPERGGLRARLLAARMNMEGRAERERVLVNRVSRWLHTMPVKRLAFYWPTRGEPSVTQMITTWLAEDSTREAGLPVVVGDVLEFAPWTPSTPLEPGAYGIQVPASKRRMKPQLLLIPCLGIDVNRYRLGYGGGYYDRTLARLSPRPVAVGIGFDCARVNTINPKPHDIRLDLALTEGGSL
jgi:5-formyltetrahydrofolate cyclo-ligase